MTVNSTTPKIHNFGNNIEVKVIPGLSKITDVSKVSVVTVKVFENNKKVYESEAWGREKWSVKVQTSGVIKTQKLASNFIVNTVMSSNNT